jgi:hypothetical protein
LYFGFQGTPFYNIIVCSATGHICKALTFFSFCVFCVFKCSLPLLLRSFQHTNFSQRLTIANDIPQKINTFAKGVYLRGI